MKSSIKDLEARVLDVLETAEFVDHPLHRVLADLWDYNQEQWNRVEQMVRVSDAYQDMMLKREKTLGERFDKHIRQLEKITRISDRYQTALREANLELEHASLMDTLTGLPNRRKMLRHLKREYEQRREDLKLAMIDIDYFKRINDEHGHLVGDEVLIAVGHLIEQSVGELGHVSRWGGEEFLVVFSHSDEGEIERCVEHLVKVVKDAKFDVLDGQIIETSVSVGLAVYQPKDTIDSLITRADDALYGAKNSGRNRYLSSQCSVE